MAILLAFALFELGSRSFRLGSMRHGLQSDARRAAALLDQDLRRSDYGTVKVLDSGVNPSLQVLSTSGALVERDGVCLAGLSDWLSGASYDALSSRPLWDEYIVYYATTEAAGGRLIRQVLIPPTAPYSTPYAGFTVAASLNLNPVLNAGGVRNTQTLSQHVEELKIVPDAPTQSLQVSLKLRDTGGSKVGTTGRLDESLQLTFQIHPENTEGP